MNKRLKLKKETLARLDTHDLVEVVAGAGTYTCPTSYVTYGASCGGVCSGHCAEKVRELLGVIQPL